MNRQLFLFVRPPRPLWPFNSPASAFWPPLAFASLAAKLREDVSDLEVQILDAPALQMGWRTLQAELHRRRPTFVGIGEEAVSCVEAFRLAHLARECGALVIAGGCFFGHVAPQALSTGLIDVVVHGEGELTLVELVQALRQNSRDALAAVRGISFLPHPTGPLSTLSDRPEPTRTPHRPLIQDLDSLPFPAYDLLPINAYGRNSLNHPQFAAIELSRGCFGSCDFCVLWRQMGGFTGNRSIPQLRVKSPERLLEEVQILVRQYGRNYLGWVDPCFNAHPHVPGQMAGLLLSHGLRIGQSAWMRTDAIVRDGASGALAQCVEAGLNETYVGLERPDPDSLARLRKTTSAADARAALGILRSRFPQVLVIGSFIYGLPGDTPESVRAAHRFAVELELDQFFFIPLTPLPGTPGWSPEMWDPTGERFRQFNFLPAARSHGLNAQLERALLLSVLTHWPWARIRASLRQTFCAYARRRRVRRRLFVRGARFHIGRIAARLRAPRKDLGLIFPSWYET